MREAYENENDHLGKAAEMVSVLSKLAIMHLSAKWREKAINKYKRQACAAANHEKKSYVTGKRNI